MPEKRHRHCFFQMVTMMTERAGSLDVNSAGHQIGETGTDDSGGVGTERGDIVHFYTCTGHCALCIVLSKETVHALQCVAD